MKPIPNYEESFKWFMKASKQGHDNAQCQLDLLYLNGHGCESSLCDAAYWWKNSMAQGNEDAKRHLYANCAAKRSTPLPSSSPENSIEKNDKT